MIIYLQQIPFFHNNEHPLQTPIFSKYQSSSQEMVILMKFITLTVIWNIPLRIWNISIRILTLEAPNKTQFVEGFKKIGFEKFTILF